MSIAQQSPDWWHAGDGLWYPPERHPNYRPPVQGEVVHPGAGQPAHTAPDLNAIVNRLNVEIMKAMDAGLGTRQILELCEARAWVISPEQPHGISTDRP